jgi:SCP-2 sterol transfer family protein
MSLAVCGLRWKTSSSAGFPAFCRTAEWNIGPLKFPRPGISGIFGRLSWPTATDADLARPSWTPAGPRTYGGFLEMRIFDFWVHERDITTPLGWPSDDGGPGAEIALAQVEGSIGYIVGKKIGLPDGASIVFRLTGPVRRELPVVVDGRARAVDHVEHPDVELTTDTVTFIQLAAGRIDPQQPIDAGLVTWTGNAQLGDHAARNLRFTI